MVALPLINDVDLIIIYRGTSGADLLFCAPSSESSLDVPQMKTTLVKKRFVDNTIECRSVVSEDGSFHDVTPILDTGEGLGEGRIDGRSVTVGGGEGRDF